MDHRLNEKYKTIKVLELDLGEHLQDPGLGDMTAKGLSIKEKNKDKFNFGKIRDFCSVKNPDKIL